MGASRPVSSRGGRILATVLSCFAAGAVAAPAQAGNPNFKPSASVRAQQRAAAGLAAKPPVRKRTTTGGGTSRTYRPLSTPTITSTAGSGSATAKKKKAKSRKKKARKRRKEAVSTYNPPRTTTDMADKPAFVTKVLREVPDGVWAGLLALALLAGALAVGSIASAVRARRMVRQRELLRADVGLLQSALLPAVPERIAGVSVSAAYRPAGGPAAGGDFYDLFPLAN